MIKKLKEDLKVLHLLAVMCCLITRKQYEDGYKRYLKSATEDEVGTLDWFIYYCKKDKEFRIKYLS